MGSILFLTLSCWVANSFVHTNCWYHRDKAAQLSGSSGFSGRFIFSLHELLPLPPLVGQQNSVKPYCSELHQLHSCLQVHVIYRTTPTGTYFDMLLPSNGKTEGITLSKSLYLMVGFDWVLTDKSEEVGSKSGKCLMKKEIQHFNRYLRPQWHTVTGNTKKEYVVYRAPFCLSTQLEYRSIENTVHTLKILIGKLPWLLCLTFGETAKGCLCLFSWGCGSGERSGHLLTRMSVVRSPAPVSWRLCLLACEWCMPDIDALYKCGWEAKLL